MNVTPESPAVETYRCPRCGQRLGAHGSHLPGLFRCADGADVPWREFQAADETPAVETLAARALAAELRATWHERYLVDGHDPLGEYGPDQARAVAGDILASDWLAAHTQQAVDAKLGEVERRIRDEREHFARRCCADPEDSLPARAYLDAERIVREVRGRGGEDRG